MKIKLLCLFVSAVLISFNTTYGQCTSRALPFSETFSGSPFASCGWDSTSAASGAGWWIPVPATNYAGGTAPEVEAYGDQANGGISETISLISPALNTTAVSAVTLSFKHNLYLTNSGASGPQTIGISVEYSQDSISWLSPYSNYYSATPSLTSVVMETRTVNISGLAGPKLYIRFSITGVLFKVWGWEIDDVNVTSVATVVPALTLNERMVYYDRENGKLLINISGAGHVSAGLCDILGNIVYQTANLNELQSIDVNALRKGIYFLKMQNATGTLTKKIILN